MWSAAFVPKPGDWPEQCEVVGTFFVEQKSSFDPAPFEEITKWITSGDAKPVFIGFGSMVIKNPEKLEQTIKQAAKQANVRVLVQSGWSKLNVEDPDSDLCRNIGPCPHDWLLPMCGAVIHHGGAGTTAAGLKLGLPTFICPFFGDQFMWGSFVAMAGVGPTPCPINKLTPDILSVKLSDLASEELQQHAKALSDDMAKEDGIMSGRDHFIDSLFVENMLCDVSLILGETQLARYRLIGSGVRHHGIKVSSEVAALLEGKKRIGWGSVWDSCWCCSTCHNEEHYWYAAGMERHAVTSYDLEGRIRSCTHGFVAALWGLLGGAFFSLFQVYVIPDRWARRKGALGCLFGLGLSMFYVAWEFLLCVLVFFDRWFLGCANGWCRRDLDYVLDSSWKTRVYDTPLIASELEAIITQGLPRARRQELTRALEFVAGARAIYQKARPKLIDGHRHYVVVKLPELTAVIGKTGTKVRLGISDADVAMLRTRLNRIPGHRASASAVARHSRQHDLHHKGADRLLHVVSSDDGEVADYQKRLKEGKDRISISAVDAAMVKPEDTTVSFSTFVHALQPVFRRICAQENFPTGTAYQESMYRPSTNSAYLN
jgi:UDP-glucoronosyl and UDP-glucosyl transferase